MMIRRHFFSILSGISLVVFFGLMFLWIRSQSHYDGFQIYGKILGGGRIVEIFSVDGLLSFNYDKNNDLSDSKGGFISANASSELGGAIAWNTMRGHSRFWRVFFSGSIYYSGQRLEEYICFFVTCPHWLLAVNALILPAVWFWRRRKNIVSQNSKGKG